MTTATSVRRAFALLLAMTGWGWIAAQTSDEEKERAEGVFKYVYGKAYDKAVAGTPKAKVEYARVLAEAAEKIDTDPTLKMMVRDKAIGLASAAPSGYRLAADLYLLAMVQPDDKASRIFGYVQILEKMMPAEPMQTKPKLVADLAAAYRDAAAVTMKKENGNPQPFFEKAKKLAKLNFLATKAETKDIVRDLERLEKDAERQVATGKELTRLRVLNDRKPEDPVPAAALAALLLRDGKAKEAALPLAKLPEGPLRKLGDALAEPKSGDAAFAEAFRAAADAAKAESRFFLERSLAHQQAWCDAAPPDKRAGALKFQQEVLDRLLAAEQGPGRAKLLEDQIVLHADMAEALERSGQYTEASACIEKAKQALKTGFKAADQKELQAALDGVHKEIDRRAALSKQLDVVKETLKAGPGDPAANEEAGLLLLQMDRLPEAAGHLLKAGTEGLRRVGEAFNGSKPPLERGTALHEAATDKTPFLSGLARREFEAALQADPKRDGADKLKLLAGQLPPVPLSVSEEVRKSMTRRLHVLFDEDAPGFLATSAKGDGKIGLEKGIAYSGTMYLKINAPSCYFTNLPNFKFPIRENPGRGEYRYLRFAWKKSGGSRLNLDLHALRPGMPSWFRMSCYAGHPANADIQVLEVADKAPAAWEVITVDLFKEMGPCEVTGVSFAPIDPDFGMFDSIVLAPTMSELNRYKRKPAK